MKRICLILFFVIILVLVLSFANADSQKICCTFSFPEETAQIGKLFSFSYHLTGGSGNYSDISIEAEFVTAHENTGNDVNNQFFEKGSLSSGSVSFVPEAGTAIILWLRGYDAVTGEYFYFECHQGWVTVEPNPDISVIMQHEDNVAAVGQPLSINYTIESTDDLAEIKSWWLIGGDGFNSEHYDERNLELLSGQLSFTPSYGEYIYLVIQGKTINGHPFYAESKHFVLTNPGMERITCTCMFSEDAAQIGKPYSFSYEISGGSGQYSNLNVQAEFVTVHDYTGHDVDNQKFDLGTAPAGTVTFVPRAGTAIILWLRGEDAITQQSFYFECHEGWLPLLPNVDYPVTFTYDKNGYELGEKIILTYQVDNLQNHIVDGKLWWLLVSDFYFQDHIETRDISDAQGTTDVIPSYGTCIYAILEGKDDEGNPIYAESEHLVLNETEEAVNVFILPASLQSIGEEAFYGTNVHKVVMPRSLTISNIAFDAFNQTPLKVIAGYNEDARTYALEHGVLYEAIE